MKVPCRWLAEYVDIGVSKEEVLNLAERLTLAGLEVEAFQDASAALGFHLPVEAVKVSFPENGTAAMVR